MIRKMTIVNKKEAFLLLLGDLFLFLSSIYVVLFLRYFKIPSVDLLTQHLVPFGFLSIIFVIVFLVAGLYEKHTLMLRSRLPNILFNAQVINAFVAVLIFYLVPVFGITPKVNLFAYIVVSSVLILIWRLYGLRLIYLPKKQNAIIIGSGEEIYEIFDEVNNNARYSLKFVSAIDLSKTSEVDFKEEIINRVYGENVNVAVVDFDNPEVGKLIGHLYNLIFSKVRFVDMHKVYEDMFDRIPLQLLKHSWFLENISIEPKAVYDFIKRMMDIILSFVLGIISLVFYPFVFLAIKIDDGGAIFISQERVGKDNKNVILYKFRSMKKNLTDLSLGQSDNPVTRVGGFLRKTRIDELPQLWNVFRGDISLIGPRPELPSGVKLYEEEIPYYAVRHLIKPGLSGWAQIYHENHPHHGLAIEKTKEKLSYDLYYVKNRSFMLDLKIAIRTIKTLLSRSGV